MSRYDSAETLLSFAVNEKFPPADRVSAASEISAQTFPSAAAQAWRSLTSPSLPPEIRLDALGHLDGLDEFDARAMYSSFCSEAGVPQNIRLTVAEVMYQKGWQTEALAALTSLSDETGSFSETGKAVNRLLGRWK